MPLSRVVRPITSCHGNPPGKAGFLAFKGSSDRFCLQRSVDQEGRNDAAALLAALVAYTVERLDCFDGELQQDLSLSLLTDSLAVTPQMLVRCHAGLLARN